MNDEIIQLAILSNKLALLNSKFDTCMYLIVLGMYPPSLERMMQQSLLSERCRHMLEKFIETGERPEKHPKDNPFEAVNWPDVPWKLPSLPTNPEQVPNTAAIALEVADSQRVRLSDAPFGFATGDEVLGDAIAIYMPNEAGTKAGTPALASDSNIAGTSLEVASLPNVPTEVLPNPTSMLSVTDIKVELPDEPNDTLHENASEEDPCTMCGQPEACIGCLLKLQVGYFLTSAFV